MVKYRMGNDGPKATQPKGAKSAQTEGVVIKIPPEGTPSDPSHRAPFDRISDALPWKLGGGVLTFLDFAASGSYLSQRGVDPTSILTALGAIGSNFAFKIVKPDQIKLWLQEFHNQAEIGEKGKLLLGGAILSLGLAMLAGAEYRVTLSAAKDLLPNAPIWLTTAVAIILTFGDDVMLAISDVYKDAKASGKGLTHALGEGIFSHSPALLYKVLLTGIGVYLASNSEQIAKFLTPDKIEMLAKLGLGAGGLALIMYLVHKHGHELAPKVATLLEGTTRGTLRILGNLGLISFGMFVGVFLGVRHGLVDWRNSIPMTVKAIASNQKHGNNALPPSEEAHVAVAPGVLDLSSIINWSNLVMNQDPAFDGPQVYRDLSGEDLFVVFKDPKLNFPIRVYVKNDSILSEFLQQLRNETAELESCLKPLKNKRLYFIIDPECIEKFF